LHTLSGRLVSSRADNAASEENGREFVIHDVSSAKGRIMAMRYGIQKIPGVVINGEKFEGKEKILEAITAT
jgi:hypothetical protein